MRIKFIKNPKLEHGLQVDDGSLWVNIVPEKIYHVVRENGKKQICDDIKKSNFISFSQFNRLIEDRVIIVLDQISQSMIMNLPRTLRHPSTLILVVVLVGCSVYKSGPITLVCEGTETTHSIEPNTSDEYRKTRKTIKFFEDVREVKGESSNLKPYYVLMNREKVDIPTPIKKEVWVVTIDDGFPFFEENSLTDTFSYTDQINTSVFVNEDSLGFNWTRSRKSTDKKNEDVNSHSLSINRISGVFHETEELGGSRVHDGKTFNEGFHVTTDGTCTPGVKRF